MATPQKEENPIKKTTASSSDTEIQIAWTKILARAIVDEEFLTQLQENIGNTFNEYGIEVADLDETIAKLTPSLDDALALAGQIKSATKVETNSEQEELTMAKDASGSWGSAGTFGSAGSVGGCAGSLGTAGSVGSFAAATTANADIAGMPSSGATAGTVGTFSGATGTAVPRKNSCSLRQQAIFVM